MMKRTVTKARISAFRTYLIREEKSPATLDKYLRDVAAFAGFAGSRSVDKSLVVAYKSHLLERGYAPRSVNSMLASVHSFLLFLGWGECRVKTLKLQKQIYADEERELTKQEYRQLLRAAGSQPRLRLVMQTICGTGIRVSELRYFTLEAVCRGELTVRCKGKNRRVLLPGKLRQLLLAYAKQERITSGIIFRTVRGAPLDRKRIWAQMKCLCKAAGVAGSKVFPHNLRKLFARTFYTMEKDIAKLADILGHSSIDTTRIYIMSTGEEHRKKIERLGLVI